jgi:integrase
MDIGIKIMQYKNTMQNLVDEYFLSNDYNALAVKTKVDYTYCTTVLLSTKVDGKSLGGICLTKMSGAIARRAYEIWLGRGVYLANAVTAVARKAYSFGMEMGYAETNPFSTFKRKTTHVRNTVWEKEQIIKFLDVAYSDFKYRSIGLIVQMAYEWCQRIGDMRLLKFTSIDYDKSVLNLQQSKRRSVVHLPISLDLLEMLKQQRDDYEFQEYVVPHHKPVRGIYNPYSMVRLSKVGRRVMELAELPSELRLMDLRRTGTTEMVEAGVSMGQIMSVTGHANPQSVKPYMKNTYASAENALTIRKTHSISK